MKRVTPFARNPPGSCSGADFSNDCRSAWLRAETHGVMLRVGSHRRDTHYLLQCDVGHHFFLKANPLATNPNTVILVSSVCVAEGGRHRRV